MGTSPQSIYEWIKLAYFDINNGEELLLSADPLHTDLHPRQYYNSDPSSHEKNPRGSLVGQNELPVDRMWMYRMESLVRLYQGATIMISVLVTQSM